MKRLSASFLAAFLAPLLLAACGADSDDEPIADRTDASTTLASTGQEVYQHSCTSCHDTGKHEAPITGRTEDWKDRSPLWQAVLTDHANAGYLSMPAKGGRPDLPDRSVADAVEYMMQTTFPDLPRDSF